MKKNQVLTRIRAGEPAVVGWLISGSPLMAECMTSLGYDGFLLDAQHGYWSYEGLLQTLLVLGDSDTAPLVRVADNDFGLIGRTLDAGALGIVIPMVNTPEEAQRAVDACLYPPRGKRSSGGLRRDRYGSDYALAANDEIMVICMIETREAVEAIDGILSVPGIDCLMIGPGDLAMSLGLGLGRSDEHEACVARVVEAGRRHGVPVGMACADARDCLRRAEQGMLFLPCGNEVGWARARSAEHLATVRNGLAKPAR
jgi:4-hydroxy-2-oxoheptanedioate aldolase